MFTFEETPSPLHIVFPISMIDAFGRHPLWYLIGEDAYQLTEKPIDWTRKNRSFIGSGDRHMLPTELTDELFIGDQLRPLTLPLTKPDGKPTVITWLPFPADMGNLDGRAISVGK